MNRGSWCASLGRLTFMALLSVMAGGTVAAAEDSWDAVFIGGAKSGYVHVFVEPLKDRGKDLIRVRFDMVLESRRLNDRVTTSVMYGTIGKPDGEILRLDTRVKTSETELRTHGDVIDGKMTLKLEGSGEAQSQTIDWPAEVRGPYAVEQSLSRQPMKAGETRSLRMYVPELNRILDVTLIAKSVEDVKLGGKIHRPLLRVDQVARLEGKRQPEFDLSLWADTNGQVLTSVSHNLGGIVTYRTTREGAMASAGGGAPFELIMSSVIKVTHRIPRPETTREVTYRVRLKEDDPTQILPNDRRQTLARGSQPNEATLVVKSAGREDGEAGPETVGEEFLRANAMITSRDDRIVEMASRAVAGATDRWTKATRIEHWVAKNLREKNFSVAFAPASEVARNLTGDCTEHGVLTAAMCRAQGVPARLAIGLVYADRLGGFGFHVWNEVYVNRRWVAIDASFEEDDVDAVHIKLADASLDGVAPYETFLPIARVFGRISIEPLEIR